MKSSRHRPETPLCPTDSVPLVADGGSPAVTQPAGDPFEALDDLMALVEALCPTWPHRESGGPMLDLRL